MGFLSRVINMIFGPDVYCKHGTKGSDGVCMDCCNDLYGLPESELAQIIDFSSYRAYI